MGGTPGVAQGLESGRIEVGVLGDSGMLLVFRGMGKPLKGASAREMGFRGVDAPITTTERKLKADRGAVMRFMQAYLETVHYFQTNKAGTARILQKYMRGVSEEDITLWCDDLRPIIKQMPYPDEEALRAEMEMMSTPVSNCRLGISTTAFSMRSKKAALSTNCINKKGGMSHGKDQTYRDQGGRSGENRGVL